MDAIVEKYPAAVAGMDPRALVANYGESPSARLQNWNAIDRILAHLGAGAQRSELTLAVARDLAVTACLIHRLGAAVALAETAAAPASSRLARLPSDETAPSAGLQQHRAVLLLAGIAEYHLGASAAGCAAAIASGRAAFEQVLLRSRGPLVGEAAGRTNALGGFSAVAAFLDETQARAAALAEALCSDRRAVRCVLAALGAALALRRRAPVAAACRCLAALADEAWAGGAGGEVWAWLCGGAPGSGTGAPGAPGGRRVRDGEGAPDGLSALLGALAGGEAPAEVPTAEVAGLLLAASRRENVARLLACEVPLRLRGAAHVRALLALVPVLAEAPEARRELEWEGMVPLLANEALRELALWSDPRRGRRGRRGRCGRGRGAGAAGGGVAHLPALRSVLAGRDGLDAGRARGRRAPDAPNRAPHRGRPRRLRAAARNDAGALLGRGAALPPANRRARGGVPPRAAAARLLRGARGRALCLRADPCSPARAHARAARRRAPRQRRGGRP